MGSLGAEPDGCANAGERSMKASKAAWFAVALYASLGTLHGGEPGWLFLLSAIGAAVALFFGLWEMDR